jgi:hypothetical protein
MQYNLLNARPLVAMNTIAERYVKLVLAVGRHDAHYVDAYYGPAEWAPAGDPLPIARLEAGAQALAADLAALALPAGADDLTRLRREYLVRQIASVRARLAMIGGERCSFDEESDRLYNAVAPHKTEADFAQVLAALDRLLPGAGAPTKRYAELRNHYVIQHHLVDTVFQAAITECRARTLQHTTLPAAETFTIEYITGQSWSAYNWYKGGFHSVIQVNLDLPITIDRAIDRACHEGYPGHHVYNVLFEQHLVRERGWQEFTVYPLFSPQSVIAEGTANLGIEVAFPGADRTAFERDVLYPLAGLDPETAERYAAVQNLIGRLSYAGNEAARRYLDGAIDRDAAVAWLERWAMVPKDRAEQRTHLFDQYRSYVINYNLGLDLARAYIERRGGTVDRPDVRWHEFSSLLSSPRLPGGLW